MADFSYHHANRKIIMKKNITLIAGIAGMLFGLSSFDSKADLRLRLGDIHIDAGDRPTFVIDTRPDFIYLEDQGFAVSVNSPYDIISYDDMYYLYRDGGWYRSSGYRGPWMVIREYDLPYNIRRHRWDDIRRYRDVEYRRHDRRYWEERDREREINRERERHNDNPPRVIPEKPRDGGNRLFDGNPPGNENRNNPPRPGRDGNTMKGPGQPGREGNAMKGPGQPGREGNAMKGPDQHGREGNAMKGPGQPGREGNAMKGPNQPGKDGNAKKAPDQPKKDDKGNNPNPPR